MLSSERFKTYAARGHADEIREGSKASAHVGAVAKASDRVLGWLRNKPGGTTVTERNLCADVLGRQERGYAAEVLAALVADDGGLVEAGENRKGNMTYRLSDPQP
ncbi:hypothetical protein [Mycobacterium sp.]|uniref:hypothetical protein n=1 Tax=Mycobacterium sp. TaxID=1785 RepID=UPI003F9B5A24